MNATLRPASHPRRTAARLAAVQALYAIEVSGSSAERVITDFAERHWPHGDDAAPTPVLGRKPSSAPEPEVDVSAESATDEVYLRALVEDVILRRAQLDAAIDGALNQNWTTDRLEVLLRAILRAGACELIVRPDVPARVVITEYLEIAHAFYAGKEPSLVNAVLDRLATTARGDPAHPPSGGGVG